MEGPEIKAVEAVIDNGSLGRGRPATQAVQRALELSRHPMLDPSTPGYDVDVSDEALPGLSRVVSVIAARPIRAGHLLRDLGATAIAELKAV